ncbi:50S ribosomal protein L25 (fragment) [Methylocella tundrae]
MIADLGALDINDSLHLTALPLPAGCKPTLRDRDFTIVTITPPAVVPEDAAAAAAATAAPAKGKAGAKAPAAAAPAAAPAKKK